MSEDLKEILKKNFEEISKRLDIIEAKIDDRNNRRSQRELNKSLRRYAMNHGKTEAVGFVPVHTMNGVNSGEHSERGANSGFEGTKQSLTNLLKN